MDGESNRAAHAGTDPLAELNGLLLFAGPTSWYPHELWRSDGTAAGTKLVEDINPGSGDSSPLSLTNVGGTLFFAASDGMNGYELWRTR